MKNDPRPPNVFLQAVAILGRPPPDAVIFLRKDDAGGVSHAHTIVCFALDVNPMSASVQHLDCAPASWFDMLMLSMEEL